MHKNGTRLYLELSFALVRDEAGVVVGALAVGRDGTARHRSESVLRARAAALEEEVKDGFKKIQGPAT